jgi:Tol biopolymer transport system component
LPFLTGPSGVCPDQVDAVWTANANGIGKPKRFTEPDIPVLQAIWSPDGKRIAFTAHRRPERPLLGKGLTRLTRMTYGDLR